MIPHLTIGSMMIAIFCVCVCLYATPASVSDSWHHVLRVSPADLSGEKGQDVWHTGTQLSTQLERPKSLGKITQSNLKFSCISICGRVCVCAVRACPCRRSQKIWVTAPIPPLFLWRMLRQSQRLKVTAPPPTTSLSTTPSCPGALHLPPSLSADLLCHSVVFSFRNILTFSVLHSHHLSPDRAVDHSSNLLFHVLHATDFILQLHWPCCFLLYFPVIYTFHALSFLLSAVFLLWYPTPSSVYESAINFSSQFWI